MIKSIKKEYIFEKDAVTPACHASTVLPLDDGRVIAAWFGGRREKSADVEIYVSTRSVKGVWSKPVIVSEKDDVPHWNPVLYGRENGEIILYYKYGCEIEDWVTKYVISKDGGKTWSSPALLVEGDTSDGRGPVKNNCLKLSNGVLLAPASTERGFARCFIDRSEDDGLTWKACELMQVPKYKGRRVWLIQPALWESGNGNVHCFMRSDSGAVYRSDSDDYGVTWCKPYRTRLPNNNSGIDCTKDRDGRLWLIYNPVDVNWGIRHPLVLSVSTDNGKHFTEMFNPEPGFGEFSYPFIAARGNKLYATYTHKRKQVAYLEIELE